MADPARKRWRPWPVLPEAQQADAFESALQVSSWLSAIKRTARNRWRRWLLSCPKPGEAGAFEAALQSALAIDDTGHRAEVLESLASQLPEERRPDALEASLQAALCIDDETDRAVVLANLALQLPRPLLKRALRAALTISDEGLRARALDFARTPPVPSIE